DEVVVLARSTGVDLVAGSGLLQALVGTHVVIDVATAHPVTRKAAVKYFEAATTNLLGAAGVAGVQHVVGLSIVGADTVDLPYYLGKRRQDALIAGGSIPWTLVRATQFHDFPAQLASAIPGPVVAVPPMLSAPVAAAEVGAHLAHLAHGEPQGEALPIRGPETLEMIDMTRDYLSATRSRRAVVPMPVPGGVKRAMRAGALVPQQPCVQGTQTFAEHLAEHG
ncbi:SDR family oxidoreductase, partial [Nocardioides sp.]|uniref:SDR family oxidoreductase n=1 Tax=Nocardioides sp. TaxID=35761 RepID=UPI00356A00D4